MVIAQPSLFPTFVGGSDTVGSSLTDLAESRVIVCRLCDQRHIMCSSVLILIRKSGRVGEYSIGTAKLLSPGIHCCYKGIYRSADMFSYLKGNIVGRCYHNGIETLLHGKNLI